MALEIFPLDGYILENIQKRQDDDNEFEFDIHIKSSTNSSIFKFTLLGTNICCETLSWEYRQTKQGVNKWFDVSQDMPLDYKSFIGNEITFLKLFNYEINEEICLSKCTIELQISFKNNDDLKIIYNNTHNGYYPHFVTLKQDSKIIVKTCI